MTRTLKILFCSEVGRNDLVERFRESSEKLFLSEISFFGINIWKKEKKKRFQKYRYIFPILGRIRVWAVRNPAIIIV